LKRYPEFLFLTFVVPYAGFCSLVCVINYLNYHLYSLILFLPFVFVYLRKPDYIKLKDYLIFPFYIWISALSCLVASFTFQDLHWLPTLHKYKEVVK